MSVSFKPSPPRRRVASVRVGRSVMALEKLGTRLLKRSFKVRPATRDRQTDLAWAQLLRANCDDVARRIAVEFEGLRARHAQASDEALGRLGDDDGHGGGRNTKDEALLVAAEREMIRAEARMRLLSDQIAHLARLQTLIDGWPLTEL